MFTVRTRTYRSKNNWHVTSTRLGLDVEIVDELVNTLLNNSTVDTDKPWVGWIENETKKFEVTRTSPAFSVRSYFEGIFFTVFAKGFLVEEGEESKIEVRYGIPWMTALGFAFIYTISILFTFHFLLASKPIRPKDLSFLLLFVTTPATLVMLYQLNKMEREVTELLGVRRDA